MKNSSRLNYINYCKRNDLKATIEGLMNWSKYMK